MPTAFYLYCLDFPNGKKYIGLTCKPRKRLNAHRYWAVRISPLPVYKAMKKHGFPLYRILCIGSRDYIAELEVRTIAAFRTRSSRYGYNVFLGGDLGPAHTPQAAAKISAANKGRLKGLRRPPEFGAKISAAKKGIKFSPEHCARISAGKKGCPGTLKGKTRSPEHCARLSAAMKLRPPPSDETRAKMSAARKGRPKPPFTVEHRANISAARMGRKCPEAAAANRKRKGFPKPPFSPEHRANMAAAAKNRRSALNDEPKDPPAEQKQQHP
jgi:hypothetical protein